MPVSRRRSNVSRLNPYTLDGKTRNELAAALKARDLSDSGNKAQLIERLRSHLLLHPEDEQSDAPASTSEDPAPKKEEEKSKKAMKEEEAESGKLDANNLDKETRNELATALKARGLSPSGTKAQLVERLKSHLLAANAAAAAADTETVAAESPSKDKKTSEVEEPEPTTSAVEPKSEPRRKSARTSMRIERMREKQPDDATEETDAPTASSAAEEKKDEAPAEPAVSVAGKEPVKRGKHAKNPRASVVAKEPVESAEPAVPMVEEEPAKPAEPAVPLVEEEPAKPAEPAVPVVEKEPVKKGKQAKSSPRVSVIEKEPVETAEPAEPPVPIVEMEPVKKGKHAKSSPRVSVVEKEPVEPAEPSISVVEEEPKKPAKTAEPAEPTVSVAEEKPVETARPSISVVAEERPVETVEPAEPTVSVVEEEPTELPSILYNTAEEPFIAEPVVAEPTALAREEPVETGTNVPSSSEPIEEEYVPEVMPGMDLEEEEEEETPMEQEEEEGEEEEKEDEVASTPSSESVVDDETATVAEMPKDDEAAEEEPEKMQPTEPPRPDSADGIDFDFQDDPDDPDRGRGRRRTEDAEPPLDESQVQMDSYNADLNMKVSGTNRVFGEPLIHEGFALMWAGIKASYGVRGGAGKKVAFQVKITEFLKLIELETEETFPHDLRIGWSADDAPLLLGEAPYSYAYCSIAKKAESGLFVEWGTSYDAQDVITCCLDSDARKISYMKNDTDLGVAFNIVMGDKADVTFFPHVATKNCRFEINFGQQGPWFPLPTGFTFMNDVPIAELVRGPVAPASKQDCTVLMMIGLPGCGKTCWVRQYLRDHPDEQWDVISADSVLDMMRVNGVARNKCHHGRWDMLMGLVAKAVNKVIQLACRRKKNYIIDQTNCTLAGRRRKMVPFREFQRKAVVLVPSEEDFANRRIRQVQETGREIPAEAMLELKATFVLPLFDDGYFDDIIYIEPMGGYEDAQKMVERYNEEGKAWRPFEKQKFGHGNNWKQGGPLRKRKSGDGDRRDSKGDADGGPPTKMSKSNNNQESYQYDSSSRPSMSGGSVPNSLGAVRIGFGPSLSSQGGNAFSPRLLSPGQPPMSFPFGTAPFPPSFLVPPPPIRTPLGAPEVAGDTETQMAADTSSS